MDGYFNREVTGTYRDMKDLDGQAPKTNLVTDDYDISNNVLGLGINGKVVQCRNKKSGITYALKVSIYLPSISVNH